MAIRTFKVDGVPIDPARIPCPLLVVSSVHDNSAAPRGGRISGYLGKDCFFAQGIGHHLMLAAGWEAVPDQVEGRLAVRFPAN